MHFFGGFDPLAAILGAAIGLLVGALALGRVINRWRPDHLFSILLFSILMGGLPIAVGSKTPNLYFCDLVVIFLLARLLMNRLLDRQPRGNLPRPAGETGIRAFALTAILYFFFVLASTWISPDPLRSIGDIKVLIESLAVFLLAWSSLRDDPDAIQNVMRATTVFGFVIAILTLVTTYHAVGGQAGLMFHWTKSYEMKQLIRLWIGGSNYLGGIMAILLPLAVVNSALARGRYRVFFSAASVVMLAAIYVTSSSGAMLALVFGTLLMTLLTLSWRSKMAAVYIMVIVGAVIMLHPEFWTEIYDKYFYSLHRREEALWLEGWRALNASPLLGIGRGISRTLYGKPLHNSILTAFVESGVLAGTLFIVLLVLIMRRGFLASRWTRGNKGLSLMARGLQISVAVGVFHSLGEILLEATVYAVVFWLLIGMLYALPSGRNEPIQNSHITDDALGPPPDAIARASG
jgi:hypothetical protein